MEINITHELEGCLIDSFGKLEQGYCENDENVQKSKEKQDAAYKALYDAIDGNKELLRLLDEFIGASVVYEFEIRERLYIRGMKDVDTFKKLVNEA